MEEWRFARKPRWMVRHVLVVALVVVMVNLGFWQLRRLDERRAEADLVESRTTAAAVGVTDLPAGDAAEYRRVTAEGTYLDDETVLVANRTHNGVPGAWVLTPLELDDGSAVVVARGFIGFDSDGQLVAPPAPEGEVAVEGLARLTQERGRFGPRDPSGEELDTLARVDLGRYQEQVEPGLVPVWVQATATDPPEVDTAAGAAEVVSLAEPETSSGPHLSYAVQWFTFSAIALFGYPLLLRKVARDGDRRRRHPEVDDDRPAPGPPDELDRELEELLRTQDG